MVKINVLVLQRDNLVRTYEDFNREQKTMRRLFDKHIGGMMVRLDFTDTTINNYRRNKVFGKKIEEFYTKYGVSEVNHVSSDESGFNLLGLLTTSYMNINVPKKSEELAGILEQVEKTAALFGYTEEDDEVFVSTFNTIRKGFVEFNPNETIAAKQRDYIVVKGIPEITVVLCTVKGRKEQDLKSLRKHLNKHFTLPGVKEMITVSNIFVKLKTEITKLKDVEEETLNVHTVEYKDIGNKRDEAVDSFVTSMKDHKANILQALHAINAIGKAEIVKEADNKLREEVEKIDSLEDLIKLTCVI